MAFTYQYGANPQIDYVRMLIGDTVCDGHIFEDAEINAAYAIQASQIQSSMRYSGTMSANLPSTPVSYYRVAALLLDTLAANRSRLGGAVTKLLDVTIDPGSIRSTANALRTQAQSYRDLDDNSGAFVVVEQCTTPWTFRDRFLRQLQRNAV